MSIAIHVPMTTTMPLADITNVRMFQTGKQQFATTPMSRRSSEYGMSPDVVSPLASFQAPEVTGTFTHNPYNWKCLPDDDQHAAAIMTQRNYEKTKTNVSVSVAARVPSPAHAVPMQVPDCAFMEDKDQTPPAPTTPPVCRALIQFKCHQTEFASPITVEKGQYVVVQGDRGIDIGVIIRVNNEAEKSYVERTGPTGSILRHATQREVDYWATDLKGDEAAAVEYCRQRVVRHHLQMEVRHAEYQFDKKKLTFYYDAKARVDFVQLLKELYREFGCRIWMEKVRMHE